MEEKIKNEIYIFKNNINLGYWIITIGKVWTHGFIRLQCCNGLKHKRLGATARSGSFKQNFLTKNIKPVRPIQIFKFQLWCANRIDNTYRSPESKL